MDHDSALKHYHALLLRWQKKINLISPTTIDTSWQRHFEDSLQLAQYISSDCKTILDLGSGAGFPALVLSILKPEIIFHLVESDQKKCAFLKTVSRETNAKNTHVHNMRIEAVYEQAIAPDIIMARALATLYELLDYVWPWVEKNADIRLIFPKGETVDKEIEEAQKQYKFEYVTHDSHTQKDAKILVISNISKCE